MRVDRAAWRARAARTMRAACASVSGSSTARAERSDRWPCVSWSSSLPWLRGGLVVLGRGLAAVATTPACDGIVRVSRFRPPRGTYGPIVTAFPTRAVAVTGLVFAGQALFCAVTAAVTV